MPPAHLRRAAYLLVSVALGFAYARRSGTLVRVSALVRPCQSAVDVAAIEANLPTGPSELHARRFRRTAEGAVYLLAWLDNAAVGHVLVTAQSKYEEVRDRLGTFPEVNALGVATAYRRRGVARALMEAAARIAVSMGGTRLGLAVEPDNEPAVGLYQALGFRRHPTVDPVDEWTWIDDLGAEHVERDRCTYWSRGL